MRFKKNNVYQMSADNFSGIDLSEKDKAMLSGSAAMAKNVFVNNAGEIEKRRGLKIIYETEKAINGVYEYYYGEDKKAYIVHEGDGLYTLKKTENGFEKDKLIYSGIRDKESDGFCFGGALFIMCEGYYKICYDDLFGTLAVGRVKDAFSNEAVQCVITQRSKGSFDGIVEDSINKEFMYHSIKFKFDRYNFDATTGDVNKMYIAKNEHENDFRVVSLKMGETEIDCYQYRIQSDKNGIYIELRRRNTNVKEYYNCEAEVVLCYTGFVYAPKNIISRLPVGTDDIDGSILDSYSESDCYTGVYTEDLNLASNIRKVNFFVDVKNLTDANYIRCCLTDGKTDGRVLKVTVAGQVVHNYFIQKDAYDKEIVVYPYKCEYVDFKMSHIISLAGRSELAIEVEFLCPDYECEADGCDIFGFFDGENDLRVFISGNEKYPCRDYASAVYEASYFPALLYTNVGNENSGISGYGRYFGYQLIFKDNKGDAEMYFRAANADSGFKILKGAVSEAAAGKNSAINVNSRLFLLSDSGLYSIDATSVEGQNKNTLRSKEINPLLLGESLDKMKMAKVSNMLMLFGKSNVYVLDIERNFCWYVYSFPYEVRRSSVLDGEVFLYKNAIAAMRDEDDALAYSDSLTGGGEKSVAAYWRTNNVCFMPWKRRDILSSYCSLSDFYLRNSAEILYNTEDFVQRKAKEANGDLFSFSDIDFSRFSFRCMREGTSIKSHLRAKRAEKFSITVRNEKNEQMKINKIGFLYR